MAILVCTIFLTSSVVALASNQPQLGHLSEVSTETPTQIATAQTTTPTPDATATPPPQSTDATVTLLTVGDLMVHGQQLAAAHGSRGYNFDPSFGPVAHTISAADIAAGNLETTLRIGSYTGYPSFRSPTAFARALHDAGFDVLTTANNHTLDGGAFGVRYTSRYLDRIGVAHTGSDNNGMLIVEHDGIKVAYLAYTYGTNGIRSPSRGSVNKANMAQMRRAISSAHRKADVVVVCPHWGAEYSRTPEGSTRSKSRALIDAGADLVLASHPHVVRPVERYHGGYIVYSMGNFISGQSRPYTDLGIMVAATAVRRDEVVSVSSLKVLPVYRDVSPGAGAAAYRTVLISEALKPHAALISSGDRVRMRRYWTYCKRVFRGYL